MSPWPPRPVPRVAPARQSWQSRAECMWVKGSASPAQSNKKRALGGDAKRCRATRRKLMTHLTRASDESRHGSASAAAAVRPLTSRPRLRAVMSKAGEDARSLPLRLRAPHERRPRGCAGDSPHRQLRSPVERRHRRADLVRQGARARCDRVGAHTERGRVEGSVRSPPRPSTTRVSDCFLSSNP